MNKHINIPVIIMYFVLQLKWKLNSHVQEEIVLPISNTKKTPYKHIYTILYIELM